MNAPRRRILLTGATSGIGQALLRRIGGRHDVLATGRANSAPPEARAYVRIDQSDPLEAAANILAACDGLGWDALDNVILNAGTGIAAGDAPDSVNAIRAALDVNLGFAIAAAHALHSRLEKSRGLLTLIGSTAHRGAEGFPAYAASKAGLAGLARALGEEWRGRVGVQIVHPGPTQTPMHARAGHDPGRLGRWFMTPGSVAAMIESAIVRRAATAYASHLRLALGATLVARRL
jgi:NAD(P)-dependent dehydrogenase (short-subunit alcohol dehydrogenase family)